MKRSKGTPHAAALGVLVLVSVSCNTASAREIYVDAKAQKGGKGDKTKPYQSLSMALRKAGSGSTVRVAAGTYKGDLLVKARSVVLLGGFAPGFAARDAKKHRSVLQGSGKDAVLTLLSAGKSKVDGFTIRGGGGSSRAGAKEVYGGGVYITGGSVTISHCVIEENSTTRKKGEIQQAGGGIYARSGDLTLVDSVIRKNTSKRGGGLALLELRRATVKRNLIEKNIAVGDHGGGVYAACKDLRFSHNVVQGNEVGRKIGYGWGGGVTIIGKMTRARFDKNLLTKNFAASLGSGYFIDDESQATLSEELIVANVCAPEGGSAIFVDGLDPKKGSRASLSRCTIGEHPCGGAVAGNALRADQSSSVEIVDSVLWNNGKKPLSKGKRSTITIRGSLVDDKAVTGQGVVHGAPAFVAPKKGDYRLSAPVGGKKPGVSWEPGAQHSGASAAKASSAKPKVVTAGVVPVATAPKKASAEDCSVAGGGRGPSSLALVLLALLAFALRRR